MDQSSMEAKRVTSLRAKLQVPSYSLAHLPHKDTTFLFGGAFVVNPLRSVVHSAKL